MSLLSNNAKNWAREMLIRHEGLKLGPYLCTAGKLTIGIGRNLTDRGISRDEALMMLDRDLAEAEKQLVSHLPWVRQLPEHQLLVLINMVFNLGIGGVLGFRRMLAALRQRDTETAILEMQDSLWARQVGRRAQDLMQLMRGSDHA